MPELLPIIRGIIDKERNPGQFIISGSIVAGMVKNASESLTGRIYYLELSPFHRTEVEYTTHYKERWFRGGFPKAFLSKNTEDWTLWMEGFIRNYIERDLPVGVLESESLLPLFYLQQCRFYNFILS